MQTIITTHGEGKLATKVFVSSEAGFNVTSTIVMGKKECVLIDCQWTRANAHRVIAEILAKNGALVEYDQPLFSLE